MIEVLRRRAENAKAEAALRARELAIEGAAQGLDEAAAEPSATRYANVVADGAAVFSGSPEGAGVLATHRGEDPFDATTVLRVAWD